MKLFLRCVALLALLTPVFADNQLKSGVFDPPHKAPDIDLPASTGKSLKLSDLRGKLVVLGFGFTHCPEVCPTTLATLTRVMADLGTLKDQVQVIYVTVDPERDSAARLKEYLTQFNAQFIGLTGGEAELKKVRDAYGVIASKAASSDLQNTYTVHHSSSLYLIDRDGLLRALVPYGKRADDIVHDIKILLQK